MRRLITRNQPLSSLFAAAAACLLLAACASLPDLRTLDTAVPKTATPTIENGRGEVPARQAASLLAKRLRNSATDLKTLAALEEAATGSPLIAGNKVTLLFDGPQALGAMMKAVVCVLFFFFFVFFFFVLVVFGLFFF